MQRAGYKPGPNESNEPEYTATRGSSSKKSNQRNKEDSKKKTAVKTKNTNASTIHPWCERLKYDHRFIDELFLYHK